MKQFYLTKCLLLAFFVLINLSVFAQTGSISGKVLDETNQPLPGASVSVKGTDNQTSTDANGNFKLTGISSGNVSVIVKYIGYQEMEKTVNATGSVTVSFQLQPASTSLNEVVVIGYGSQRKKDLTGSISTVASKDFQKGSIVSPEQLIVGKVAGVSITSNGGAPGGGSTIRIRGGASINAGNDPLIVVDGVPLTNPKNGSNRGLAGVANPLSLINPNDIESFTVLKDAASTAIYGSRASNGVILITTKKGKSSKPVVNFNTQFSAAQLQKQIDVLTADEFRTYVNANGTASQKAMLGTQNTNWQDEIFQRALSSDNNISITGTTKKVPYRVSAGFLSQKGVLITDNLKRTSGALSASPKFFKEHLKIDLNLKGTLSKSHFANQSAIGAAASFDPTQPVYDTNQFGNYFEWANTVGGVTTLNPNATRNPVSLIRTQDNNSDVKRSFGNLQLDYRFHFLPELHANLNLGYDVGSGKGDNYIPATAAQSFSQQGSYTKYRQDVNNKVGEFYLNYIKDLKSIKSNINATAGYGYYDNLTTNNFYPSFRANMDTLPNTTPKFPFDKPQSTLISYYGRLIYTLNDKFILAGSIRTDGSSKFAKENRWGVFPSAALTWRISEEGFLKSLTSLSDLKLRISYGKTGNQEGIDYYPYLAVYGLSGNTSQYQLGNNFFNGYTPAAYDKNLRWEETSTYNAGIDYGFLNNRINGSVDVYFKKTTDLLNTIPIPVGSNFSNEILTNVGNMENKGIEFNISAIPVATKDLNWDLGFNLTYNKNKITKLTAVEDPSFPGNRISGISGGTGTNIQVNSVGYQTNSFYVYKQVYDANNKPLEGVYEDLNGDGIINEEKDLYRYKSPNAPILLGFSTRVSYKKWNLNTVLRSSIGNYMYNNLSSNLGVKRNILNPGQYLQNSTTNIFSSQFSNNQFLSDYYIENASFLRMDNLGIGYNVGKMFSKSSMNLNVYANCQNVFTVTKYSGLDPEINNGIDNNFYPRARTFVLGLNLGF
ncbi:MAG: rane protein [Sphingobacteriales bacterium]|nr:rane protein [Sphingobacteriales bacterium]